MFDFGSPAVDNERHTCVFRVDGVLEGDVLAGLIVPHVCSPEYLLRFS